MKFDYLLKKCYNKFMKRLLKQFLYYVFLIQEKALTMRLGKTLDSTYKNQTSKTFISATEHLTLSAETEKIKTLALNAVLEFIKTWDGTQPKILEKIESTGFKVCKVNNADKFLKVINEEEGLICELKGVPALYINILTNSGFSFSSKPVFIVGEKNLDPMYLLHHYYKLCSLQANLPGFDYKAQRNFKKYLKNINGDISQLSTSDILALQEAIARDQEATDFVLTFVKQTSGAKNVHKKMSDGGANI